MGHCEEFRQSGTTKQSGCNTAIASLRSQGLLFALVFNARIRLFRENLRPKNN
jgi:hypothetical protein